jgi:N-acetylneuraminic acid mutarotase
MLTFGPTLSWSQQNNCQLDSIDFETDEPQPCNDFIQVRSKRNQILEVIPIGKTVLVLDSADEVLDVLHFPRLDDRQSFNQICNFLLGPNVIYTDSIQPTFDVITTRNQSSQRYHAYTVQEYLRKLQGVEIKPDTNMVQHQILKSIACRAPSQGNIQPPKVAQDKPNSDAPKKSAPEITVESVSPKSGLVIGGKKITIKGEGFTEGMQVLIDNQPCTIVQISETEIQCKVPRHVAGTFNISITNPETEPLLLDQRFTYKAWKSFPASNTTPSSREGHTAIWTGKEMIVWGGFDGDNTLNDGYAYNPVAQSWSKISSTNAPLPREGHTAIWTGKEMIVWGGTIVRGGFTDDKPLNDGYAYNPVAQSWSKISSTNAPLKRDKHTAVWTGKEMIIWGGFYGNKALNDGYAYNPQGNSWRTISSANAPSARIDHSAIWTGKEMIVWGGRANNGYTLNDGYAYNPVAQSWSKISSTNAPLKRDKHTAVWTGKEMIVWNGDGNFFYDGYAYNPVAQSWSKISSANAPMAHADHTAIWTGKEMIVWGGWFGKFFNDGGIYYHVE